MRWIGAAELIFACLFCSGWSFAASVTGGAVIEDFSTLDYADLSETTGVWNVIEKSARAAAFANGEASRPIQFGNGSDGVLNSSSGYVFDTDSHPNGYQFVSVNISAGAISVKGSNPLIIRSLGSVTIVPTLPVHSSNARHGGNPSSGDSAPPIQGRAVTCEAHGGIGGAASGTAAADGGNANQSDGSPEPGRKGSGETGANTFAVDAIVSLTGPASNDFDALANFICGTSGAGGGGYSEGGVGAFASGASGGAGGGRVRITAVGDITVNSIEAIGGNGGNGAQAAPGKCSGNGGGGNGGVVWLQTLGTLSAPAPDVSAGSGGASACFAGSGPGIDGFSRGDSAPGLRPGWAAGDYDTDGVPANTISTIQSKEYDLKTWNAGFATPPDITQTLNGGQIEVQYAGSKDKITYTDFTADLNSLGNRGFRYLKFRIQIRSAGVAGPSPKVTRLSIPFSDLGLKNLDIGLGVGCGTHREARGNDGNRTGMMTLALWLGLWIFGYYRVVRAARVGDE